MAHKTPMLHSIYDLTTFCRSTTGDVPAKLVGASTTVVGSKMYLFGGRLVTERRMVSDLYVFDLETFVWEQIPPYPEDEVPRARYFHSTDAWNDHLVVFGGMSNQPDSINPDELCVLNDVHFFNLATRHWLAAPPPPSESDPLAPRARYAHLSSVTADRLFVIGGQDFFNTWLDDVCVFDLGTKTWVQRRDYPRHCGTYRSVAVSSTTTVRSPEDEMQASLSSSTLGPSGSRFKSSKTTPNTGLPDDVTPSDKLVHLPYTSAPTEDHPSDIYLYSNYNFTDVKRELEVFSPLPDTDFTIQDRSSAMTGSTFPPGLRFPTGALLGNHLIIAGTYLAHSYQSFSIWVLDLTTMTWSRIDPGKAIETGSWFRGCLWAEANRFLIFGNRHGNLVDDYNRRLLSWDHVAIVDLEAFGIYQPPPLKLDVRMQELGLAALEERVLTDFEIICDDGQKLQCSRKILEDRWPWFKEQRKQFLRKANLTLENLPNSAMHIPLPDLARNGHSDEPYPDPRLTPRSFQLSESYPVTLALMQYFYSLALITPLQHTAGVLSQLLILATNYRITHLEFLVKHAMHRSLSNPTSVGVYEVATLCSCRSLQIRALKTVMSYTQKRPSRRSEKESGGSTRQPDSAGERERDGGIGGGSGPSSKYLSRPRGTSDAKWRTMTDSGASSSGYNSPNNAPMTTVAAAVAGANHATIAATPPPAGLTVVPASPMQSAGFTQAPPENMPASSVNTATTSASVLLPAPPAGPTHTLPTKPSPAIPAPAPAHTPQPPPSPQLSTAATPTISNLPTLSNLPTPTNQPVIPAPSPATPYQADHQQEAPKSPVPPLHQFYLGHGNSSLPAAIIARLPRRPTTADATIPVSVAPAFFSRIEPSDDIRGALISKKRPGTDSGTTTPQGMRTRQGSLSQASSPPLTRGLHLARNPAVGINGPASGVLPTAGPSSRFSDVSSLNPSMITVSTDSAMTLLTPMDDMPFLSSLTTAESEFGNTEEEYHMLNKDDISKELEKEQQQKSSLWTERITNGRWTPAAEPVEKAHHLPPGLDLSTSSRAATPVMSSASSSFARFLSRGGKDKVGKEKPPPPAPLTEDDASSNSGHNSGKQAATLAQIKSQIAELEEERKRLKKEAKIRALLNQTSSPIAMVGGMAM